MAEAPRASSTALVPSRMSHRPIPQEPFFGFPLGVEAAPVDLAGLHLTGREPRAERLPRAMVHAHRVCVVRAARHGVEPFRVRAALARPRRTRFWRRPTRLRSGRL
eukprot:2889596-Alexandrium_andersonii.AAC.1